MQFGHRQLQAIEPGTTISGNVDNYQPYKLPSEVVIELAGCRSAIRHILYEGGKLTKEGRTFLQENKPDLCIFGHTHQPSAEWFGQTLLFNSGSAGPQWFNLPRGLAKLPRQGDRAKENFWLLTLGPIRGWGRHAKESRSRP